MGVVRPYSAYLPTKVVDSIRMSNSHHCFENNLFTSPHKAYSLMKNLRKRNMEAISEILQATDVLSYFAVIFNPHLRVAQLPASARLKLTRSYLITIPA